ncbi:hypothetical protein [Roseateles saccharophilus]|uniref:MSHA biogenesis protein MshJ n=1 Tax=Roseateles saccharophilus TaxID=304 RepID=A0A4R3UT54_ROSSA|nr:hypothetical protein [Roseateles saccharophilus]MDG0833628.1 hypothetical protein [Roseateles saccharophilus]TCU93214.1 MSHA biogenesis protein MshJ [Roseateles saccharophilus]
MKAGTRIDMALLSRRLAPLQARWERQAKRIDGLSLRERVILFLSIVAVLAAIFDTLVLSPLSLRAKLRSDSQAQQAAELKQLREQFVAASRSVGADPADGLRQRLDAAQAERQRLDAELRRGGSLSSAEALSAVLQRLLAQQPGLVLERLRLLDDSPVTAATAAAPASAARPAPSALPGISWQGVELQVQGGYRDLQHYLQALEQELPGLRWGEMHLSASGANDAPRLVAQLFLLKVQP